MGVRGGETILLHASLRSVGFVCGGATAVVLALLDVLGPAGNLIVPAQTPENRDPARWRQPCVPGDLLAQMRENILAFDPLLSSAMAMGIIAETVRTWPGACRSTHPQTSFAGIGPAAQHLLAQHDLDCQLGERSPLGALYRAGARFLLLGVGWDKCTAFHLAEYRLPNSVTRRNSCVINGPHGRQWIEYDDLDLDASDFSALGHRFEQATASVSVGSVGAATARLAGIADAVSYALQNPPSSWIRTRRLDKHPKK